LNNANKTYFILPFAFIFSIAIIISGCFNTGFISQSESYYNGIKKIEDLSGKRKIFTHKYLNKNSQELPLTINTGIVKKDESRYTELVFTLSNKNPINFEKIILSNSNEQIWNWDVHKKYRDVTKDQGTTTEKYITRVDIMTNVLSDFFIHKPIYLTFSGDSIVNKKLKSEHVESLSKTITFADKVSIQYLLDK
jgi:uncharacterized protein YueI